MKNHPSLPIAISTFFLWGMLTVNAAAQDYPAIKRKVNLPPSAELNYAITARQSGFSLSGHAVLHWHQADNQYSIATETRAMLVGKILETKSVGSIDAFGLAPSTFYEKHLRKDATTTTFDRAGNTIRYTHSTQSYPIKGGEQDRSSATWQLVAIARAAAEKFKPGSEWVFFTAGQHDAEPWTFKVLESEKISTPLGAMNAVHIVKAPPPDAKGQQLDIWLAPALEWYPVRLRFINPDGSSIDQTLESIKPK